ncbi:hypothetical protein AR276_10175 [Stenotrophomonas maltophilia]|nr:hypothetical protein AR276_10175 [Stenotrophomonas maltophilia]
MDVLADQVQQMLGQGGGPGGALQSAGNGDDTEGRVICSLSAGEGSAFGHLQVRSPAGRLGQQAGRQPKA